MRPKILISLVSLALLSGAAIWAYLSSGPPPAKVPPTPVANNPAGGLCSRVPVSTNCDAEVVDGFQGEVHPLLHQHAQMELNAYWNPPKVNDFDPWMPLEVRRLYTEVSVAVPARSYSEKDFSMILPPENINKPGQLWALDPEKFASFLTQFHPAVSMHSASVGRRPGPDGAFAVLRGVSSSHMDVIFRIHAEFELLAHPNNLPIRNAWYSPACFLGRLVINRRTGTVDYFRLGVPTETLNNVHTTMWIINKNDIDDIYGGHHHHMHSVDRMELVGGTLDGLDEVEWTNQIEIDQAHNMLAKVFYKFSEIDFVPFDQILAAASEQKKPIMAVVLLGALQDQSC